MKLRDFEILQIVPAVGFNAAFANEDATVYTRPLACWALVKREIDLDDEDWNQMEELNLRLPDALTPQRGEPVVITRVEGMTSINGREISPCENDDYFLGYVGPGEDLLDFQDRARDLVDSFMEDEDGEGEDGETVEEYDRLTDSLPQALSHLSVQVQERIRHGNVPSRWEQGGWLEFMKRFGDLSGG